MSDKIFLQLPTFVNRTYRGGALLREFLRVDDKEDNFCPEDWISSFVEAKNKNYIRNEGITKVVSEGEVCLINEVVDESDFGVGRESSGVLIKLLDAAERLGIQVHPTKEYAKKNFGTDYGKTECWYILDTRDSEACIYIGFKEHVTKEYFRSLFEKQDIPAMLDSMHRFEVSAGDVVLVTASTPHAIGAGCFLLEVQEPTDYTMRVEKMTVAGEKLTPTQIHYGLGEEKMLDCFSYDGASADEIKRRHFLPKHQISEGVFDLVSYKDTECFALRTLEGGKYSACEPHFVTAVVLGDGGTLTFGNKTVSLKRGEKYFIAANTQFEFDGAHIALCFPPENKA